MSDMFLIEGRHIYDPCGIGIYNLALIQQVFDASGVGYFCRIYIRILRRGVLFVEPIKCQMPSPCKGDMYCTNNG